MIKTKETKCFIYDEKSTYYWVEIIQGKDAGIRISVPKITDNYSSEFQERILNLEKNNLLTASFISETTKEERPKWEFIEFEIEGFL